MTLALAEVDTRLRQQHRENRHRLISLQGFARTFTSKCFHHDIVAMCIMMTLSVVGDDKSCRCMSGYCTIASYNLGFVDLFRATSAVLNPTAYRFQLLHPASQGVRDNTHSFVDCVPCRVFPGILCYRPRRLDGIQNLRWARCDNEHGSATANMSQTTTLA